MLLRLPLHTALLGGVLYGPAPCSQAPLAEQCNGSWCHPDNSNCPPVTTHPSGGEHPHLGQGLPRRLCAGVLRQVQGTPEALQLVDVLPVARLLGSRLGQQPHLWRVLAATAPGRAGGLKLSSARQVHAGVASLAPARAPRLQAQGTVALLSDSRAVYFRSDRGPAVRPDGRIPYRWQVGQRVGEAGEWQLTTG